MQDRNLAFRRRARSLPSDHRDDELLLFSCISSMMIIWRYAFSVQGPVRREDLAFNSTAFACTEYFRYRVALDVRVCRLAAPWLRMPNHALDGWEAQAQPTLEIVDAIVNLGHAQ
jgi:hypothetical protein